MERRLDLLLRSIPKAVAMATNTHITISRYDLFHGHLFWRPPGQGAGLLLHALEYPAYDSSTFPVNLGHCQQDSPVLYSDHQMKRRNIVVLFPVHGAVQGYVLDASVDPVMSLIPEYLQAPVYTLDEATLGLPVADVYFLVDPAQPLAWSPRISGLVTQRSKL